MKNITRYVDIIPTLSQNIHLITHVSINDQPWQTYFGSEIQNLKEEILEKLYVQQITVQLTYEKDGVYPVLVFYVSDDIKLIEFKLPDFIKDQLYQKDSNDGIAPQEEQNGN